jgi:hypothetical protein
MRFRPPSCAKTQLMERVQDGAQWFFMASLAWLFRPRPAK